MESITNKVDIFNKSGEYLINQIIFDLVSQDLPALYQNLSVNPHINEFVKRELKTYKVSSIQCKTLNTAQKAIYPL